MTLNRRQAAVLVLLLVGVLGGCGPASAEDAAAGAERTCPPPDFPIDGAIDVAARCRRVLALADERLGLLHGPVVDVDVRWNVCAPNARCLFLPLTQAWVIYRFSVGDPVMIHVRPPVEGDVVVDDLVADAPQPVPGWLLDELDEPGRDPALG